MQANPIPGALAVLTAYPMEGHYWLEVDCRDYEHFASLPHAVEFEGRRYGRISWNSDRLRAYYTTRQSFAVGV